MGVNVHICAGGQEVFLPSEAANATILASRISGRTFEHLASVVRHARRDIRLLYVAQGLRVMGQKPPEG